MFVTYLILAVKKGSPVNPLGKPDKGVNDSIPVESLTSTKSPSVGVADIAATLATGSYRTELATAD